MSCDNLDVYNVIRHLILAHLSGQVPLICCSEKFDFRLKNMLVVGVVEFVVMIFVDQTILNDRYTRFLKVTLWGRSRSGPVVNAIPNLSFP